MSNSKNIVLVNQSTGYLTIDNINACCQKYDNVAIICGGLDEGERKLKSTVNVDSICKYDKTTGVKRFVTWSYATLQIFFKLLFKYRDYEIMYFTNPPMACFCSLILTNKFSIVEYDIYPDALCSIGIKPSSPIYRIWARINKKLFAKAERVITLSEGMEECLMQYVSAEKIRVVPLWSGSDIFNPIDKGDNPFAKEHDLQNKFVVLYSGNIGYTHNVEVLVYVADRLKDFKDIVFLIIGEGEKKKDIQDKVTQRNLSNVTMLPYQNFSILPYSLASADLGVITLDDNVAKVSVPSKTFNLMAVGSPLLAIANEEAEIYRLVTKYCNGRCIPKSNVDEMAAFILELKNNKDLKAQYSANSIKATKDFTYKNAELYN